MSQDTLFDQDPHYCVDTNVLAACLVESDDELYGRDVFAPQWAHVEKLIASGRIVAPHRVEIELDKWRRRHPEIHDWVLRHRFMFRGIVSSEQLATAKKIVNAYPVYGETLNYLGDLEVISLASALGIPVITMEGKSPADQISKRRPKIPNICEEFGVECLSFVGFLRRENFGA